MSNDLNLCSFIGRLGKSPEVRYSASGDTISSFTLAVGSQWKDKSGNKQESVEWVNCTAFGKLGEIVGEYLVKGSQVYISGRMKTEKYTSKDGQEKYSTKIVVQNMQMLGSKQQSDDSQPSDSKPSQGVGFDDIDDDIPF